ncbi:hypothetical protein OGATHE_002521 [Ogataea polymorpha]|uniref:Uncharacterized protein n=1 Tax=Ogataea polymorpha TaxID=460523 RepID=A0A9P8T8N2_9ASCO|nr:hypothetical protein OGATHE_002521 [Ogataea polymorpha]
MVNPLRQFGRPSGSILSPVGAGASDVRAFNWKKFIFSISGSTSRYFGSASGIVSRISCAVCPAPVWLGWLDRPACGLALLVLVGLFLGKTFASFLTGSSLSLSVNSAFRFLWGVTFSSSSESTTMTFESADCFDLKC